jgi:hypothetical protein
MMCTYHCCQKTAIEGTILCSNHTEKPKRTETENPKPSPAPVEPWHTGHYVKVRGEPNPVWVGSAAAEIAYLKAKR